MEKALNVMIGAIMTVGVFCLIHDRKKLTEGQKFKKEMLEKMRAVNRLQGEPD